MGDGGFCLFGDGTFLNPSFARSQDSASAASIQLQKTRGSVASPASVQSGDSLGNINFSGYNTSTLRIGAQIAAFVDRSLGASDVPGRLVFGTTPVGSTIPVERMRINSSGGVGIGAVADSNETLRLGKSLTGSAAVVQQWNVGTVQSDVTGGAYYYRTFANTVAANFTTGEITHYDAVQGPFGAGATVISQIGFHVRASLTGAVSNYGFYGNIPAGVNRWNFYAAGTANNYFAGNVLIGATTDNGAKLQVNGGDVWTSGSFISQGASSYGGDTVNAKIVINATGDDSDYGGDAIVGGSVIFDNDIDYGGDALTKAYRFKGLVNDVLIKDGISTAGSVEALNGVILKAPNGSKWRIVVSDTGALSTTAA